MKNKNSKNIVLILLSILTFLFYSQSLLANSKMSRRVSGFWSANKLIIPAGVSIYRAAKNYFYGSDAFEGGSHGDTQEVREKILEDLKERKLDLIDFDSIMPKNNLENGIEEARNRAKESCYYYSEIDIDLYEKLRSNHNDVDYNKEHTMIVIDLAKNGNEEFTEDSFDGGYEIPKEYVPEKIFMVCLGGSKGTSGTSSGSQPSQSLTQPPTDSVRNKQDEDEDTEGSSSDEIKPPQPLLPPMVLPFQFPPPIPSAAHTAPVMQSGLHFPLSFSSIPKDHAFQKLMHGFILPGFGVVVHPIVDVTSAARLPTAPLPYEQHLAEAAASASARLPAAPPPLPYEQHLAAAAASASARLPAAPPPLPYKQHLAAAAASNKDDVRRKRNAASAKASRRRAKEKEAFLENHINSLKKDILSIGGDPDVGSEENPEPRHKYIRKHDHPYKNRRKINALRQAERRRFKKAEMEHKEIEVCRLESMLDVLIEQDFTATDRAAATAAAPPPPVVRTGSLTGEKRKDRPDDDGSDHEPDRKRRRME